eukprot:GHRR01032646.1.p1 GENE.GHRR01032646.1~~GHRR01032646.1.p1  ORF type:complete len:119 (-),score=12.16 GHRR01032646.1:362-718(-)
MSGIASASAPGGMEQQQQQEQVAANTAQTLVCVRLRPASSKETGVRCVSSEGPNNVNFQNIDRAISAYCYDKVYGEFSVGCSLPAMLQFPIDGNCLRGCHRLMLKRVSKTACYETRNC